MRSLDSLYSLEMTKSMSKQNFITQYIDFLAGKRKRPRIPKGMHVSAAREYMRIMNAMQSKKPRATFAKKLEKRVQSEVRGVQGFSFSQIIPAASITILVIGIGIGALSFFPRGNSSQLAALPVVQDTSVQSRVLNTAESLSDFEIAGAELAIESDEEFAPAEAGYVQEIAAAPASDTTHQSSSAGALALANELEKILEGVELLETINDDEIFADLERDFADYANGVVGGVYITQYAVDATSTEEASGEVAYRPVDIRSLPSSQFKLNVARDALTTARAGSGPEEVRMARIEVLRESGAVVVALLNERLAAMDTDQILDTPTKLEFSSDLARMRARIAEAIPLLDGATTDRQLQLKALLLRNSWRAVHEKIDEINTRRVSVTIAQLIDRAEQGLQSVQGNISSELHARLFNILDQSKTSSYVAQQKNLLKQFVRTLRSA